MPLRPDGLDELVDLARLVGGDAGDERGDLADCPAGGLLDLAVVERLERDWRLTSFSSSTWRSAPSRSSLTRPQRDLGSSSSIDESVPLKSKRFAISREAWSTALRTSCCRPRRRRRNWACGHRLATACNRPVRSAPAPDGAVDNVHGSVPEWPKGADCKSAGIRLRRFKSFPAHADCRKRPNPMTTPPRLIGAASLWF